MGANTLIEWCDATFNVWSGCTEAVLNGAMSPGCLNCYARRGTTARILRGRGLELWGEGPRLLKTESGWKEPGRWFRAAVRDRVRLRVFCASQGDVFEDRRDLDASRNRLWKVIERTAGGVHFHSSAPDVLCFCTWCPRDTPECALTPGLDWLLLTKRPEAILSLVPEHWRAALPPNVWIGTSVENQEAADARIPHLLRVPARVRFLSLEPLLAPVDVRQHLHAKRCQSRWAGRVLGASCTCCLGDALDWLIIGGESGHDARPCDLAWVRDLRDQGRAAGVPVFVKQLGGVPYDSNVNLSDYADESAFSQPPPGVGDGAATCGLRLRHPKGGDPDEWPVDLRVRELPSSGGP